MTDINDKATYDYYHPEANRGGERKRDWNRCFRTNLRRRRVPTMATTGFAWGDAMKNAETFKPPIAGTGQYGGCYRCRGKNECCNTICTVCPICVYNVPCCPNNCCLWTIWCWFGIPLPHSFCTAFACEMIGPSVAYRGKHGELTCQAIKLDEKRK